jgi:hypothetical protein
MLNNLLNNFFDLFPIYYKVDCSKCFNLEVLFLSIVHGVAMMKTKSGNLYCAPVKRTAILSAMFTKNLSVSEWVNDNVMFTY